MFVSVLFFLFNIAAPSSYIDSTACQFQIIAANGDIRKAQQPHPSSDNEADEALTEYSKLLLFDMHRIVPTALLQGVMWRSLLGQYARRIHGVLPAPHGVSVGRSGCGASRHITTSLAG